MMIKNAALIGLAALAACGGAWAQTPPAPTRWAQRPIAASYLTPASEPNSLAILPPAPSPNSATQKRDDAAAKAARALVNGPRWAVATEDANLNFPAAAEAFSCPLAIETGPATTPRLSALLQRSLIDAGLSTYPSKNKYHRPRPFMVAGGAICTPQHEKGLRGDGSYPSGHAAVGWAWALILAEAAPERQDAILARGRAFMLSRVVCNVHWRSDVEAGATMGAAVVARLHDSPEFRADLAAAREEITAARAAGAHPTRDCAAEAQALASAPDDQP